MAQGTNNQVRHVYVNTASNTITAGKDADGLVYFKGTGWRSDLINPKTATIKATRAWKMQRVLKTYKIDLSDLVTSDFISANKGKTLIVNTKVRLFVGCSDFETLERSGEVYITGSETGATDVAAALASSLTSAYSNLFAPLMTFTAASGVITVKEVEQPWKLGRMEHKPVQFEIYAINANDTTKTVVTKGANSNQYYKYVYDWCTIEETTPANVSTLTTAQVVGNGKDIADLEYFYLGERGDQYRNVGWPNVIDSDYKVDPTKNYDVIEIHYAFEDSGVGSYRTEKNITIVGETGAASDAGINAVLTLLNTAFNTSVSF